MKVKKYQNLEDRSKELLRQTIRLCKLVGENSFTKRIISQLIACSGSVGANYLEAGGAMSKRDFIKCIKISRKEARECLIWIEGLEEAYERKDVNFEPLKQEYREFTYIFTSIIDKIEMKK